jgi:hypothetical protein
MAFHSHYLEVFNLYPGLSTFRCFLDMTATVRDRLPPPRHTFNCERMRGNRKRIYWLMKKHGLSRATHIGC